MTTLSRIIGLPARTWNQLRKIYYSYHNPEMLVRLRYRQFFGRFPDLENPQTLNEKILWLMLFADKTEWPRMADKYGVREYVEERGLGYMLNDLYGVWEDADDIDFEKLPLPCILKTNNGCGHAIIIHDIKDINQRKVRRQLNHTLHHKFGRMTAERHYLDIPPCIIAEKLLPTDPALGESLVDYKFFCFDGEPRVCMVCYDRTYTKPVKIAYYDCEKWENRIDYASDDIYFDPDQRPIPRPKSLDQMLDAARRLSAGQPFVRVDFYEIDGKPIFGELTMAPGAGLLKSTSDKFQHIAGAMITLPKRK